MRRRAIGGTDGQRHLELAHGDGRVTRAHRHPAEAGVPRRVERIELDDPIGGEGEDGLIVGLGRELGEPPGGVDVVVIVDEQGPIFLDGARRITQLLGETAHDRVRTVGAGRHRHERRGLLERLERRLVALLGERRPEGELRAITSRPIRRRGLQRGDVARGRSSPGLRRLGNIAQRRANRAEALVEHLVERALQLVDGDAQPLADGGIALGAVAIDAHQRAQRRHSPRVATMCSTRSDAW